MSTKDISRFLLQPEKRYSGVRMQQGRVLLDSDYNEGAQLDDDDARRTLLDILCAKGTPNSGFLVGTPAEDSFDFSIGAGSFYLGGLRFDSLAEPPETFLTQHDWLQIDVDSVGLPVHPSIAELTR